MPLIVTPGQFTRRAEFYHQFAQLTSAGLGLVRALEELKRNPPARSYREPIRRLLDQLAAGCTFAESLQHIGQWLPAFDIALLQAGEHSGRLDACFRLLADYYNDRARIARQMITDLAYPIALLHFAVFIFPFAQFFASGNLLVYLGQTFGVLIPIYALVALLIYAAQSKHGESWRAWVETVLHPVPVLGTARRYLALSRLAAALEALISAGVTIIEAWELAAKASGSPVLRRAVQAWKPRVLAGQTPAEAVSRCSQFPEMFANLYNSGEISGKLDESLGRLHRYYQEEGTRKLHAVAQWTPRIIYLAVALMIAYRIVQFWTGYFKQIQDAGGF
jgi:type II secretory pathway component PulF